MLWGNRDAHVHMVWHQMPFENLRAHTICLIRGGLERVPPFLRWSSNAPQNHPHRRLGLANRRSPRSYHLKSYKRASNALQILLPSGAPAQWNGLGPPSARSTQSYKPSV